MMKAITNSKRILAIEDNPCDFAILEEYLTQTIENVKISHAKNFKKATEILSLVQNEFDVVLLDLSLPDKTGMPLIKEILKRCAASPVIVVTAYTDMEFAVKSLNAGVCDYLLKEDLSPKSLYKSILYSCERKKASFYLEVSEQKLRELFQSNPIPMWVIDFDTLQFLKVNQAAINQYGYSRDEFLLMRVKDIRPATETSVMEDVIEKCRDYGKAGIKGTFRHRKRNGEIIVVDVKSNTVEYKGKKAALIVAADITERSDYIHSLESEVEKQRGASWAETPEVRTPLARLMDLTEIIADLTDAVEKDRLLRQLLKSATELNCAITEINKKTKTDTDADCLQMNQVSKPIKYA